MLKLIYDANLENEEMLAYIALYHVFFLGQEEKWEKWENFAKNIPSRYRLAIQRDFQKNALSENYTCLNPTAIFRNYKLFKNAKSFAVDFCKGNENLPIVII